MPAIRCLLVALAAVCIGGCGKTSEQREQERIARETALRQALEKSLAEEQQKTAACASAAAEAFERLVNERRSEQVVPVVRPRHPVPSNNRRSARTCCANTPKR
jgi:hypothetical protein